MKMHSPLSGRSILIVEDEVTIALDIAETLKELGAKPLIGGSLQRAHELVDDGDLSAAVLDYVMMDGHAATMCSRLQERGVPFVLYTGYPAGETVAQATRDGAFLAKPARMEKLIQTLEFLLVAREFRTE